MKKIGTILITGAARRIGRHLAISLSEEGFDIIVHHGHSPELADEVVGKIKENGQDAVAIQADLADPLQIKRLYAEISHQGYFNILINNASIFSSLTFQDTSLAAWEEHLAINLTAPFLLSQGFFNQLPQKENGHIINILDWRALRPGPDHFPYTISKAGLVALTKSLAAALAPRVRVNGIALGAILPPSDGGKPEKMLQNVPMNRVGMLEEVTKTIKFLLTGLDYITGEIINLDGGRHLI